MFFDKYASISRMVVTSGDTNKESYQNVSGLEALRVNVQPSSPETAAITEGIYGKTYTIFTSQAGVKDGDRITISGAFIDGFSVNKSLQIANVRNEYYGPIPHFEIIAFDIEE
jgi:hypothetical protein